jgi:hypothetical protein
VLSGTAVLLRREALLRWLWELYEAWSARRSAGPLGEALAAFGHAGGDAAPALDRLADVQLETLWLHELGEHRAGERLGPDWAELRLATGGDRRIEPRLRALRDHLADCMVTLPTLRERSSAAAIHLWFPRLQAAYGAWRAGDDGRALDAALEAGRAHWQRLGAQALALYRRDGASGQEALARLLSDAPARC